MRGDRPTLRLRAAQPYSDGPVSKRWRSEHHGVVGYKEPICPHDLVATLTLSSLSVCIAISFETVWRVNRFYANPTRFERFKPRADGRSLTGERATLGDDSPLPTKASLHDFVIRQRDRGIRPVTCNTYIGAMNAFCGWLHQEGHLAERLKLPKLRVEQRVLSLLTEAQMRILITYKARTFREARLHLAILMILDCGLRISEVLNLRKTDIDCDNLILKAMGKGQKQRLVPFSPELRKRLYQFDQLKTRKGIGGELLFAGFDGAQWEKRNSTTSLHLLQRKCGLATFGWHRLRHTFAMNYLRSGGDVVRLSRVLGHSQIATTMRYVHLLTEDLTATHQRVSILNRLR